MTDPVLPPGMSPTGASYSSGHGAPSAPAEPTAAAIKRRQVLLLAGIAGTIVAGTLLSVSLTGTKGNDAQPAKPQSTNILAPGAQVDPRDAWRGQADAQLKAIEQRSRDLAQRNAELEGQGKEMLERLKKLEGSGLTPLPPPPVAASAARPSFGPDRPGNALPDAGPQRFPPPPPPMPQGAGQSPGLPPPPGGVPSMPTPTGIVSIVLGDVATGKGAKAAADAAVSSTTPRDTRRYLPSGAFTRAVLLGGLDAPTGGQAQRNPQPVLLRLADNAILPNQFRARVKECFIVGAGYGDVSSERAYIRTESLSCVTRDGTAIDVPVKGYVAGEDGKAGMRGRLVSKQGQILANALLAGVASGIGHAFTQSSTTLSVSPLGTTSTVDPGKQLEAGLGTGVGKALDRLAQYYISLAEKVFPVIEVDAGRSVDVVLTQGVALPGTLDAAGTDPDNLAQLAERARTLRRNDDEDD
ncbi:MAG: TrbI/VirB10 family protein [Piscinibacter sp.]|uniref:TrbI/VirB10 family protein n=1 Tax=Piscinibacter sp. TaxID=1903157 RepID=UPI003D0B15B6